MSLRVEDLTVRYGGLVAVDGVSLAVPVGQVVGLIGPNGAGKTTLFNACSGLVRPARGRLELFGQDITRVGAARRAQLGLGRTFQRMELFDSLTVAENVALGREGALAGSLPWTQLLARPTERDEVRTATKETLEFCGIDHLARRPVGALATGERRLVELARVLAGNYRLLLLDEPSSGLDAGEARRFAEILQTAVQQRDVGVLLVEHHMALVMEVCDHIYVLDFGRLIFEGTPRQVQKSDVVRKAYLGEAA